MQQLQMAIAVIIIPKNATYIWCKLKDSTLK